MKRSQALDIIWEAINELEDANLILSRLEKAGMMPPDTGKGYPIETVTPTGSIDYGISKDYRWEEEGDSEDENF
jgi:hypothetical protein